MIEKAHNGYAMYCDNCPNSILIPYAKTFKQTTEEAKGSGWINRQIDGEWHNFCCEECYKEKKEGS